MNLKNISFVKNTIKAGLFLLLITGAFSCQKDFLEKKPLDAISDADVWRDLPLVNAYVVQTYSTIRAGWWLNSRLEISSDDGYGTEKADAHLIQRGEVSPSNLGLLSFPWTEFYTTITRANKFMANVQGANLDALNAQDANKVKLMMGEMKVIRAYCYFRLLAFYGGVPLITKPFQLTDDFLVERNSYDDVLNFVVKELDDAATMLPLTLTGADKGRVTKGAALAVKSRALLYAASAWQNPNNDRAKWQKAADAAEDVIKLNQYTLQPDYKKMFTEQGNFNNEMIWELVLNQDLLYSGEYRTELKMFPNGNGGWGHPAPTQSLVDSYETKNGLLPKDDPTYDPQNPYVNRDPRFYASILYNGAPWQNRTIETFLPGGKDSNQGNEGWNASWTSYYARKYVDESITLPTATNVSSPNWPLFRYAEILLNFAEAKFRLGDEGTAREYLNKVRSRPSVLMPDVTESGVALEKRIMNERRIELYLEEHRFFDIRRWKITPSPLLQGVDVQKDPSGHITYALKTVLNFSLPERMILAPIPLSEIQKNKKLVQNPGYNN